MPRHEKKVILFLVEGESDEISFEGLLKDFFSSYDIHVIVKSAVLKKLCSTNTVYADLPYEIYYLSRNLEHVLHNRIENLSNTQKAMLSDEFDERFENRLKDFLAFISDKTFAVTGSYKDTWNFIQQGNNSLKRYSNVHLIFEK